MEYKKAQQAEDGRRTDSKYSSMLYNRTRMMAWAVLFRACPGPLDA